MSIDGIGDMITFARVVEARSFSEAARRLGLSKSAVSKQVARLENRLGARLLNRTTRRISPTEVGAALYERCSRIAAEVEEAEEAVMRLHAAPRGVLRVNAPMSFGHLHLAPAIAPFLERYPEVRIDLSLTDRFVDVIDEGFDVVIRIARLENSSLIARKLAPARRIVCASPDYVRRHGSPETPADLIRHDCILYANHSTQSEWCFEDPSGRRHTVRVDGRLRIDNGDAGRAMLLGGGGVALMPTFLVGADVQAGRLVHLLPEYEDVFGGIYALYPHSRHLSPKVRAFIDHLGESFGPEPYWDRDCSARGGGRAGD